MSVAEQAGLSLNYLCPCRKPWRKVFSWTGSNDVCHLIILIPKTGNLICPWANIFIVEIWFACPLSLKQLVLGKTHRAMIYFHRSACKSFRWEKEKKREQNRKTNMKNLGLHVQLFTGWPFFRGCSENWPQILIRTWHYKTELCTLFTEILVEIP